MIIGHEDETHLVEEFPNLIRQEENVHRVFKERAKERRQLSTKDIVTFFLFTAFFLFILFAHIDIPESYQINNTLTVASEGDNPSFD